MFLSLRPRNEKLSMQSATDQKVELMHRKHTRTEKENPHIIQSKKLVQVPSVTNTPEKVIVEKYYIEFIYRKPHYCNSLEQCETEAALE